MIDLLIAAFFVVLSLATFHRVLAFSFTDIDAFSLISTGRFSSLTDAVHILTSELMAGRMPNAVYYRPFLSLAYGLEWRLWGLDPWGYHLVDILVHGANAGLVYLLCRTLYPRLARKFAMLAGLFFLWHPLQVENVPAIARLGDLLGAFWITASLLCFLLWQKRRQLGWWGAAMVCGALATGTKEPAIFIVPLLFLAAFFDEKKRATFLRRTFAAFFETLPLWVFAAVFLILRHHALGSLGGYESDAHARTGLANFFFRLQYNVLGHVAGLGIGGFSDAARQQVVLFFKQKIILWIILWIGIVGGVVWYGKSRWRDPAFRLLAAFIFFQAVMIHLSFFMFRYLYLTLIPVAVLIVVELSKGIHHPKKFGVAGIIAAFLLLQSFWAGPLVDFRLYERWRESAAIGARFVGGVGEQIEKNPQAQTVFLFSIPYKRYYRSQSYFFWDLPQTQILLEHAVQDYLTLKFPHRPLRAIGVSYVNLWGPLFEFHPQSSIEGDGIYSFTVQRNAEFIDYPWIKLPGRVSGAELFKLAIDPAGLKARAVLTPRALEMAEPLKLYFGGSGVVGKF